MIEIELFFKTVESEIRRKHIKYLKKQKCISSDGVLEPKEGETEDEIRVDKPQKVKSFNKGIDTAIKVLQVEYAAFDKRLKEENKKGGKF